MSNDANDPLIDSLREALRERPNDVPLLLHLSELLLDRSDNSSAIALIAQALLCQPESTRAQQLMAQALGSLTRVTDSAPVKPNVAAETNPGFDWRAAEKQVEDVVAPRFVDESRQDTEVEAYVTERPQIRLADVGGMSAVKQRLEAAFLIPMRNPDLRRLYGKSLRGGLLLYGPPGCGKTFLARAIAGELDAKFVSVGIADVLDWYVGRSEQNLHEVFSLARRKAPCVLFFDELDALGQRRSQTRNSAIRTTVNQLLLELDSTEADNEGVFVLGATNQPWDVDSALRRPGRFDRTVLVLPPDAPARRSILTYHLKDRPVAGIDLERLVDQTEEFSGADLAHLCESAAERALVWSAQTGDLRMIDMTDMTAALGEIRPSTGPWLETARNVALFANEGGVYDELVNYLKQRKLL